MDAIGLFRDLADVIDLVPPTSNGYCALFFNQVLFSVDEVMNFFR